MGEEEKTNNKLCELSPLDENGINTSSKKEIFKKHGIVTFYTQVGKMDDMLDDYNSGKTDFSAYGLSSYNGKQYPYYLYYRAGKEDHRGHPTIIATVILFDAPEKRDYFLKNSIKLTDLKY